jgi:hypothetical protein
MCIKLKFSPFEIVYINRVFTIVRALIGGLVVPPDSEDLPLYFLTCGSFELPHLVNFSSGYEVTTFDLLRYFNACMVNYLFALYKL